MGAQMQDAGFWEQAIVYFMMGVFPWIFVIAGIWLVWSAHQFMKNSYRVTGTVIGVHQSTSTSNSNGSRRTVTTYKPVFEYVDAGGLTQKAETFLYSTTYNFAKGEQREILVNPDTPDKARMPGFMIYGFGGIFIAIGSIFGIICIFALRAMT